MSNQDTITAYLTSKGLTQAQIAGVEGNLKVESGFDPRNSNPGEGAIGIAQWEGPRRRALDTYAADTGGTETNLNTQLGFLWHELTGSESGSLRSLRATDTPAAAATVFDQQYERSAPGSLPQRVAYARKIYAATGGASTPTDSGAGGSTPATVGPGSPPRANVQNALDANPLDLFGIPGDIAGGVKTAATDTGSAIASGIGAVFDPLFHSVESFVVVGAFVVGGLVLVGLGIKRMTQPVTDKATQTAGQLAPLLLAA